MEDLDDLQRKYDVELSSEELLMVGNDKGKEEGGSLADAERAELERLMKEHSVELSTDEQRVLRSAGKTEVAPVSVHLPGETAFEMAEDFKNFQTQLAALGNEVRDLQRARDAERISVPTDDGVEKNMFVFREFGDLPYTANDVKIVRNLKMPDEDFLFDGEEFDMRKLARYREYRRVVGSLREVFTNLSLNGLVPNKLLSLTLLTGTVASLAAYANRSAVQSSGIRSSVLALFSLAIILCVLALVVEVVVQCVFSDYTNKIREVRSYMSTFSDQTLRESVVLDHISGHSTVLQQMIRDIAQLARQSDRVDKFGIFIRVLLAIVPLLVGAAAVLTELPS
jgi:hypothetical protein